jgi:uncharacterized membrane protein
MNNAVTTAQTASAEGWNVMKFLENNAMIFALIMGVIVLLLIGFLARMFLGKSAGAAAVVNPMIPNVFPATPVGQPMSVNGMIPNGMIPNGVFA